MDTALQTHLGGAPLPGFPGTAADLLQIQIVGRAAQIPRRPALRESAKAAMKIADVGVIDIAIDHVTDAIAAKLPAQPIGVVAYRRQLPPARRKQRYDLSLCEPPPVPRTGEDGIECRPRNAWPSGGE